MEQTELKLYLQKRLKELDDQKDMREMVHKGKLSFGIISTEYAHLPAWKSLQKQKKKMVRLFWIDAILLSVMVVGITSDIWDMFSENWWKALLALLLLSGVILVFFVFLTYFNLFTQFRQTEREVRKLIYEDILHKMENDEMKNKYV